MTMEGYFRPQSRANKIKQTQLIGQHLACAELLRRGYFAQILSEGLSSRDLLVAPIEGANSYILGFFVEVKANWDRNAFFVNSPENCASILYILIDGVGTMNPEFYVVPRNDMISLVSDYRSRGGRDGTHRAGEGVSREALVPYKSQWHHLNR